jgi:hypothetical protein
MIDVVLGLCIQSNLRKIKVKGLEYRKHLINVGLVVKVNKTEKMENLQLIHQNPEENNHVIEFYREYYLKQQAHKHERCQKPKQNT